MPAKKVARVGLPENGIAEVIEFDPSLERGRLDIDIRRWAHLTGILPTHALAPYGKNAWHNDPDRDRSHLERHWSRGYPTPPDRIAECQSIAQRNARELAEQMGYADFTGGWPSSGNTVYLPKRSHLNIDTEIHADELPSSGKARGLPEGETGPVIQWIPRSDDAAMTDSTDVPTPDSGGERECLLSPYDEQTVNGLPCASGNSAYY